MVQRVLGAKNLDHGRWGALLRRRFLAGVPWGTLVVAALVLGVYVIAFSYPVVPKGDEEIRFQVNADHTEADIDRVLEVLASFDG